MEYQLQKFAIEIRVIALDMRGHGIADKTASSYMACHSAQFVQISSQRYPVRGRIAWLYLNIRTGQGIYKFIGAGVAA